MKHKVVAVWVILALAWATGSACGSDHVEAPQVVATLDLTIEAIEKGDYVALWNLTDARTQTELIDTARDLQTALANIDTVYADSGQAIRDAARRQLGHEFVSGVDLAGADAGPTLLSRMMHPERLRFDQQTRDGLGSRDITIDEAAPPARAIVHTSSGEALAFVRTPNGWRSLLVRAFLRESPVVAELRSNAKRVIGAVEAAKAAQLASRDPAEPVGAYNLAVDAIEAQPRDGATLYTLLDDAARAKLVEMLSLSREVQRQVQKRTTKRERRDAYSDLGLTLYVGASSDRQLFERWSRSRAFVAPLGFEGPAASVKRDADSPIATVETTAGASVRMTRDGSGTWRVADQAPALDAALGTAVRRALR